MDKAVNDVSCFNNSMVCLLLRSVYGRGRL